MRVSDENCPYRQRRRPHVRRAPRPRAACCCCAGRKPRPPPWCDQISTPRENQFCPYSEHSWAQPQSHDSGNLSVIEGVKSPKAEIVDTSKSVSPNSISRSQIFFKTSFQPNEVV